MLKISLHPETSINNAILPFKKKYYYISQRYLLILPSSSEENKRNQFQEFIYFIFNYFLLYAGQDHVLKDLPSRKVYYGFKNCIIQEKIFLRHCLSCPNCFLPVCQWKFRKYVEAAPVGHCPWLTDKEALLRIKDRLLLWLLLY